MRCTDLHAHLTPLGVIEYLERGGDARREDERLVLPAALSGFPEGTPMPFPREQWDLELRIAQNRERGISKQVLSVPPYFFGYAFSAERGAHVARLANDDLAHAVAAYPDELLAFATVPLQAVGAAVAELERTRSLGFAGVEIGTNIAGVELDDPKLEPFWAACAALDATVFLHPHHQIGAARAQDYYLHNLLANPAETGLAAARLIFGGVLERHAVRILLSHCGGILPHIAGRLDHGYRVRLECATIPLPPSAYLSRFWFDTIAHDTHTLQSTIDRVGVERIVVGTDAPFDMGITSPLAPVDALQLSPSAYEAIAYRNADALLPRAKALS